MGLTRPIAVWHSPVPAGRMACLPQVDVCHRSDRTGNGGTPVRIGGVRPTIGRVSLTIHTMPMQNTTDEKVRWKRIPHTTDCSHGCVRSASADPVPALQQSSVEKVIGKEDEDSGDCFLTTETATAARC